jgi:hypothetical protein
LLERLSPVARSMIVDPRPALRTAKTNAPAPLFLKTDSHWNGLGAFVAYQTIVQALATSNAIDRPDLATLDHYDIAVEPFQGGDMAVSVLHLPWYFADEKVTLRAKVPPPIIRTEEGQRIVYVNPEGKSRLLLFGDSFAPPIAELLARHFKETDLRLKQIWQVPLEDKADVMLLQIVERHLPELVQMPPALVRGCPGAS